MVLYPDVQKKAQQEIENVIGSDRLPVFADRNDLPYVNALAMEVLRWHNVTPTGVLHFSFGILASLIDLQVSTVIIASNPVTNIMDSCVQDIDQMQSNVGYVLS